MAKNKIEHIPPHFRQLGASAYRFLIRPKLIVRKCQISGAVSEPCCNTQRTYLHWSKLMLKATEKGDDKEAEWIMSTILSRCQVCAGRKLCFDKLSGYRCILAVQSIRRAVRQKGSR